LDSESRSVSSEDERAVFKGEKFDMVTEQKKIFCCFGFEFLYQLEAQLR